MTANDELDLIENILKLMDKYRVDVLEYNDIKIAKKHPPKAVRAKRKSNLPKSAKQLDLENIENLVGTLDDPHLYDQV